VAGKLPAFKSAINPNPDAPHPDLEAAVAKGCVPAMIHMEDTLQFYSKGVWATTDCPKRCDAKRCYLNHGIVIVGAGVEDGAEYWLIQNSWGTKWGKDGFGKFAKGPGINMCGIETQPSFLG